MIAPTPAGFSLTGRALGRLAVVFALLVILAPAGQLAAQTPESVEEVVRRALFTNDPWERDSLLAQLAERGNPDVAPALITALRFVRGNKDAIAATLLALTGADHGESWHDWMLWQEAHPEITPFDGFDGFKADVMAEIDVNFRAFLRRGVKHEIRLEEITWGGVMKGGIPALVNPTHYLAEAAGYLVDEELVFGVEINGDARAYPCAFSTGTRCSTMSWAGSPSHSLIAPYAARASSTKRASRRGPSPSCSAHRAFSTVPTS